MKTGIIFDLDGTLLDSMGLWVNAGGYYLESMNIIPEEGLGHKLLEMNMEQGASYIKKTYGLKLSVPQICQEINSLLVKYYAEKVMAKDGVIEFLNFLKEKNIPFSIATNTDRFLFEPCLKRLGIYDLFTCILTCSELKTSKNVPDIFYEASKRMNCDPEYTYVFEDALYSLKTAKEAGFITAGIYDKYTQMSFDGNEIKKYSIHYFEDYSQVLNQMKEILK